MQLIGRREEQRELQRYVESNRPEFVVVYGRRRVGKTYLVRQFFDGRFAFYATGVARGNKAVQLKAFNLTLRRYGAAGDAKDWFDAFEELRELLEEGCAVRDAPTGKMVVFIDEMPWMDTPRSEFLVALEFFWNSWASARDDLLLVACGSATSWIVKNLFRNRGGLHNRVTGRIHLNPFTLRECEELLRGNGVQLSRLDIIEAYMIFGGIPYYLELLSRRLGLVQNVDALCFSRHGQLHNEFEELFRSLFRHSGHHISIVRALGTRQCGVERAEILRMTGISDGGTFATALDELEQCGFIRRYRTFPGKKTGELYQLIDPFTLFWLRFVEGADDRHWWSANRDSGAVRAWRGHAFELVCLWHVPQMLRALGVWGVSVGAYSWRSKKSDPGAQIDLLLDRRDGIVNICEMKWVGSGEPYRIDKEYGHKLLQKRDVFAAESGTQKALHLTMVTPNGVARNAYWNDIAAEITAEDLFAV